MPRASAPGPRGRPVGRSSGVVSRVPQGRYLYERLGEKSFQRMCSALLAHEFPDVTCMPVGQADGGRDAVRGELGRDCVVYQVKWSANAVRDPVAWLSAAVRGEADNIRRLVEDGATQYHLMTSVAGTSGAARGTMDRLDKLLRQYSSDFGVMMRCWWRADLDARLDKAPEALLWSYADMLAGWDLMRYLIDAPRLREDEARLRKLVTKVVATQRDEDSKVKFKQVDLDSYGLLDLYVDVDAERIARPRHAAVPRIRHDGPEALGGVARYLLDNDLPLTLVRGAPGQGKSTLAQYLCQLHRVVFLGDGDDALSGTMSGLMVKKPRLPLRIDLRDYASWLVGHDPFTTSETASGRKRGRRSARSIESFLVRLMQAKSGDMPVTIDDIHEVVERFPLLLVLDGLDEVASSNVRGDVVTHIDELCARLGTNDWAPQVVVTTRPNSSGLAEPSADRFETIALKPLGIELRRAYLDKWVNSRGLTTDDRATLSRIFEARSTEPHIEQLAENPMQLTILLYLIQKRGDSIPHVRTELYRSYMETFLDREAAKSPAVHKHREDLEEVTAYLGWHFQANIEFTDSSGQLSVKEIKRAILNYLYTAQKDTRLVDELFTAVTDRVWALTSKEQGSFQFDVQPVQEYFAARHLYHVAGAELPRFDASEVFRALVRRPYWVNTCRFYAGFAAVNELAALAEVLEEEIERSTPASDGSFPQGFIAHTRKTTWTLLADGVFAARPRTQERVVQLIADDLSVRLISHALRHDHDIPSLTADRGGAPLVDALRQAINVRPHDPISRLRRELVELLLRSVEPTSVETDDIWWRSCLESAVGTEDEPAWLALHRQGAAPLTNDIVSRLTLDDPHTAQAALNAGISPPDDSVQAQRLVRAVLDGHCGDAVPVGAAGEAPDLVWVLAAHHFHHKAHTYRRFGSATTGHPNFSLGTDFGRRAYNRLITRDARYKRVHKATHTGKGQKDTTSVWGNTAREIAAIHGPCLLAAEIALIGAALPPDVVKTGGDITRDSSPLGMEADYGRLVRDVRHQRSNLTWWVTLFRHNPDPLSRATWTLALLAVADTVIVADCLDLVDEVTCALPAADLRALRLASSRTGASGVGRRLGRTILPTLATHSIDTTLLVLHHTTALDRIDELNGLPDRLLGAMIDLDPCSWPAVRAVSGRMIESPSSARCELLCAAGPLNPIDGINETAIRDDAVGDILVAHTDMPEQWLLAAEARHATAVHESPLIDLATTEHWFE